MKDEDNEEEESTAIVPPLAEQIQTSENNDGESVSSIDQESEIPSEGPSSQSVDETPPAVESPQEPVALAKPQLTDLVVPPAEPEIEESTSSKVSSPQQLDETKSPSGQTQTEPLPAAESDAKEDSSTSVTPIQASEPLRELVETTSPNVSTSSATSRDLSSTSEEPSLVRQESEQTNGSAITDQMVEVESLQAKLKEVEQRFSGTCIRHNSHCKEGLRMLKMYQPLLNDCRLRSLPPMLF